MLHLNTVTPTLLKIIRTISAEPFFADFRLVGGTALSLHLGHRMSVDADFFSNSDFDKDEAVALLAKLLPSFLVLKKSSHGFAATSENVKLDIYTWQVPFLLPPYEEDGIRLAALPDIAGLKLEAIANRKEEKDYRDAHTLLQQFSLAELLQFFRARYPNHSPRILTDHLIAAPYIERDETIMLIQEIPWETVSSEIVQSVTSFYQETAVKRAEIEQSRLEQRLQEIKKGKK